jgi:hypothetical protein
VQVGVHQARDGKQPPTLDHAISADEVWQERTSSYTAGRVVEPGEVASVIAFLTSEAAAALR